MSFFSIFPLYSGYRDKGNRELLLTTDYTEAYLSLGDENEDNDIILRVMIKFEEVVTATPFDLDVYKKFNKEDIVN